MSRNRKRNVNHRQEVMNSQVRLDGVGEDPAVKAMLSPEFAVMPDLDASRIALALAQILNGQDQILKNEEAMGEAIAKLQARMDAQDRDNTKWEEDRAKFLADVENNARSLLPAEGPLRDQVVAKASQKTAELMKKALRDEALNRKKFIEQLEHEPTETIISPGHVRGVMTPGGPRMQVFPQEIRIKNFKWVLPPNTPVVVPRTVANRLREIQRTDEEADARKTLMSAADGDIRKDTVIKKKWDDINKQYKSKGDAFPVYSQ